LNLLHNDLVYHPAKTHNQPKHLQQAHTEILDDFQFESLAMQLYVKMVNYLDDKEKNSIMTSLSEMQK